MPETEEILEKFVEHIQTLLEDNLSELTKCVTELKKNQARLDKRVLRIEVIGTTLITLTGLGIAAVKLFL